MPEAIFNFFALSVIGRNKHKTHWSLHVEKDYSANGITDVSAGSD